MDSAGLNFEFQDLADQISLTSSERLCEYLQSITDCSVRRVRVEELDSRLDCIDIEKLDLDSLCFNFPPNLNDSPLTFAWGLVMYKSLVLSNCKFNANISGISAFLRVIECITPMMAEMLTPQEHITAAQMMPSNQDPESIETSKKPGLEMAKLYLGLMFIDCLGFLATLDRDLISKTREILRNLMNDELISNLIHDKISKIESTYLKVLILGGNFTLANELLNRAIKLDFHETLCDALDACTYYYFAGVVKLRNLEIGSSIDLFEMVINYPASTAHLIQVEACKKYILACLIAHGKLKSLRSPGLTIGRTLSKQCAQYFEFCDLFESALINGNTDIIHQQLERLRPNFERDGNLGLVELCIKSIPKHLSFRLMDIYSCVKLKHIGDFVGLNSENQVLNLLKYLSEKNLVELNVDMSNKIVRWRRIPVDKNFKHPKPHTFAHKVPLTPPSKDNLPPGNTFLQAELKGVLKLTDEFKQIRDELITSEQFWRSKFSERRKSQARSSAGKLMDVEKLSK